MDQKFLQKLILPAESKIVMIILDGLGGLPRESGGKTELETAVKPNLNALAARSALGLTIPVGPGITAGSGPGHLAMFGYDPVHYEIGRGALEALGVNFELGPNDLAARGNFCTVDETGIILDRRAGRLPTETSIELIGLLSQIEIEGVKIFLEPVKEHRFAFVMRAPGLGQELSDTDPLKVGVPPLTVHAKKKQSEFAADRINTFIREAQEVLKNQPMGNGIMLRGFAKFPQIPSYTEMFGLNAAAIAVNGMYRGVARLAGMKVLDVVGTTLLDEFETLEKNWQDFNFFYLHFKKTDTCGENGDFDGKVRAIEEMDALIPRLLALNPDVVVIGGDHSSPAVLKSHSWHPVPVLLFGKHVRPDDIVEFGEQTCIHGNLGLMRAQDIMPLALANAGRIAKYGA
ncbi:MAG: 2,3-bisphosphoglycerate-independent phosphoglycerate mutase [Anaerolineaceae bacterium]